LALLVPATEYEPVKPENITSMEIGYKAQIGNNLYIDAAYFRNIYNDFITQVQVRKAAGIIDQTATSITEQNVRNAQTLLTPSSNPENTFQTYTNVNKEISSQGFVLGLDYTLPKGFKLTSSYNWNKLNEDLGEGYINEFNTPESKINFSVSNRKLTDYLGFNVTFRWQDAFRWEASFGQGDVPAFSTVDAQVSYRLPSIKSVAKIGASNLLNQRYGMSYGGPTIGSIYYLSLTFDEFFN
jgi:outer membrane receptor protein involved in Fe transport